MSDLKKIKLKIINMHCTACAMLIDGDLEELAGIKSANTNYAKSECEIEFDEKTIEVPNIIAQIEKTGYKATLG